MKNNAELEEEIMMLREIVKELQTNLMEMAIVQKIQGNNLKKITSILDTMTQIENMKMQIKNTKKGS